MTLFFFVMIFKELKCAEKLSKNDECQNNVFFLIVPSILIVQKLRFIIIEIKYLICLFLPTKKLPKSCREIYIKTLVDVTSLSQLLIMGDDLNRAKLLLGRQLADLQKTANDGFRFKS